MSIVDATADYEAWLSSKLTIIPGDLKQKHASMADSPFSFLRATFYRWYQRWLRNCPEQASAPVVLAVGDLHVENFGTWRDAEGRLVWGINDFDECFPLPYPQDLTRLGTSAVLAAGEAKLALTPGDICDALLRGYQSRIDRPMGAYVLAENHGWLYHLAMARLKRPADFWSDLTGCVLDPGPVPPEVKDGLVRMFPAPVDEYHIVHRTAGLGSLGRQRFVAIATWQSGKLAREAKALTASACRWVTPDVGDDQIRYHDMLTSPTRGGDPFVAVQGTWIVRRLAPDCTKIKLKGAFDAGEPIRLLEAMGRETAHVHLSVQNGSAEIARDLSGRTPGWLLQAVQTMVADTQKDWDKWRTRGITS